MEDDDRDDTTTMALMEELLLLKRLETEQRRVPVTSARYHETAAAIAEVSRRIFELAVEQSDRDRP